MKAFLKALAKEGVLSIVILVLLCVLVWFGGMLFVDEDNDLVKIRIIIIVVLLSIWVVLFIVQKVLAIRNAQKIEAQLKAQAGAHLDGASADQKDIIDEMRQKFDDSLSALKKTKGGKSALFTLPWYVIIGPPGSGKTTALQESGLNFPASDAGAKVKGIGGTRNCDWWFTEDGILLDTAGRYTTVADDNKEWTEFLDMIRIGRKTKPINGVIVAMSLDDVLRGTQAEIDQMARDIGNRVAELSAHLHAVFPVYVLFTKADLVKGFVEFYEDFTREERNQVWGWTFPFGPPDKQYITIFDERMAELNERIEARRMKLLSTERPDRKKESIYLFPSQMRLAQKKMREFMGSLFSANTFQESTVLRGVYLTSGTQDGTPIDQILARMNKVLGVDPAPIDESRIEKKSFFIHNLFKKIIFKDKVLARSSSKLVRKRKSVRLAVQGVSVAALALLLWVSVWSFITNKGHINDVEAASASLKDAKDREKLEALDELRLTLEPLLEHETEGVPLDERWGMYQGERMLNAGVEPYLAELNTSFVNDTKELIEKELISSVNRTVGGSEKDSNRQGFFEMLDLWRAYRMMCGQMDVQADLIVTELQGKYWNAGKGKQDSGLANKQLAFYASLISYSKVEGVDIGVFLEPNTGVEKAANKAIEAGSWRNDVYFNYVRKAYRNLEGSRYQKLDPSLPKRLTYQPDMTSRLLPYLRVFTQDGWDNYLQEYLEDALATMRDLFKNLNRTWDEPKMYKSLHEYHAKMIDEAWDEYLACVHLEENKFDNIDRCDGSLRPSGNRRRLGDECSELVKSVEELRTVKWEAADVPYSTPARNIDSSYLEGATAGLDDFTKALVDYAKATKKNRRFRDLDDPEDTDGASAKLDVFLEAAGGAFEKSSYDGTGSEAAVAKFYTNLMRDFGKVVASDAYVELKDRWKQEVLSQYNLGVKGKFPFNQDVPDEKVVTLGKDITRIIEEVNKYKDADMAIVSSLFNGVDGIVKRNFALQDMLAGKKLAGVDLFTDPGTKAVFDQELADLRKAIFHKVKNKDSKTVNVEFKVRIVHEKPATGMTFTVGVGKDLKPQVIRRNPFQVGVFGTTVYWFYPEQDGEKVKSQLGARIYIENSKRGSGQDPGTRGETGRQWELLRLFWFGSNVHRRKVKMKLRDEGKDRIVEGLDIYEYYLPTNKNPLMCSIWVWPFTAEEGEPFDVDTYKDLGTIDIFNERGDK